jgi:hypothetical protein
MIRELLRIVGWRNADLYPPSPVPIPLDDENFKDF